MFISPEEKTRYRILKHAIDMSKDHFQGKGDKIPKAEIEHALDKLQTTITLIKSKVKGYKDQALALHKQDPSQDIEDILDDATDIFIVQYADAIKAYLENMKKGLIGLIVHKQLTQKQVKLFTEIKEKLDGMRGAKDQQIQFLIYDWFETGSTLNSADHLMSLWEGTKEKVDMSSVYSEVGGMRVHFTVLNLSPKQREEILKGVQKASSLLKQSKFPKLDKAAYGDVAIIEGNTNSDASYDKTHDTIWVNLKNQTPYNEDVFVQALIHEICHRYYEHVLDATDKKNWDNFYKHIMGQTKSLTLESMKKPLIGDSMSLDHGIYIHAKNKKGVDELVPPGVDRIISVKAGNPAPNMPSLKINIYTIQTHVRGVTQLITDLDLLRVGFFPTQYASEDPEEFLAEAMSLSITGLLNPKIKKLIEDGLNNHFVIPYTDTINNIVTKPVSTSQFAEYSMQEIKDLQPIFKKVYTNPHASNALKEQATEIRELIIEVMGNGKPYFLPKHKIDHFLSEAHKLEA